jgi:hypothetical protein
LSNIKRKIDVSDLVSTGASLVHSSRQTVWVSVPTAPLDFRGRLVPGEWSPCLTLDEREVRRLATQISQRFDERGSEEPYSDSQKGLNPPYATCHIA